MSPEEIQKALKEYGLTIEEASKKAQSLGISLQEYLSKGTAPTSDRDAATFVDPRLNWQSLTPQSLQPESLLISSLPELAPMKRLVVKGFVGRREIDSTIQPFGYDLFSYPAGTFLPSVSVATPPSYVLGAGDEVVVTVWGETQLYHRLTVNREGNIYIPDVGPVAAQGLTIVQFRDKLLKRMSGIYSSLVDGAAKANTFLDVSLARLKTIQVFVLGEVRKPGGYALSSMSGVLHALYLAGGPTGDGTLREVQVIRKGGAPEVVDVYAYILEGDKSKDGPLTDGDIVFVKPAGRRVALTGQVLRPAIYEMKEGENLGDLLTLAGGVRFDAYTDRIHVERIVPFGRRREFARDVLDYDLRFDDLKALLQSSQVMENGDIVTVYGIADRPENRVIITGNVNKPGRFEFHQGMRVADLLRAADSLKLSTFAERATVFRLLPNLRKEVIGFNAHKALEGDERENLPLQNEDSVVVYAENRFFARNNVTINGAVRNPGEYPRYENMTVADLVVMAGGLQEGANLTGWELSRVDTSDINTYTNLFRIDGGADYWRSAGPKGTALQDFDVLFVPFDPRVSTQKFVVFTGYVMFPGRYSIRFEGERLADMFKRAGGLRPGAYPEGSRLIRKFNNAGLVPLDFHSVIFHPTTRDNVVVYDGDSINVAFIEDVIYVSGEVYVPSPVLFEEGAGLSYYIRQAGGYKEEADNGRTVVFLPGGKKWEGGDILPGSTIFVPREVDKPSELLPIVRDMVTILASLAALTVALVQVTK